MSLFNGAGLPAKTVMAALVLAIVGGLGIFGASQLAFGQGQSDPSFVPHANSCVSKWGFIRVVSDTSYCSKWEKPFLIASEEKVDALTTTYINTANSGNATAANYADTHVECNSGDQATGGGAWLDLGTPLGNTNAGDNVALQASYPQTDLGNPGSTANGWRAFARELQNIPADASPQPRASGPDIPTEGYYGGQMTWGNFSGGEATYTSATGSAWTLYVYVICMPTAVAP
jgi:hypothetical protein